MSIEILEDTIGFFFKRKSLLLEALTHRSFLNEHRDLILKHNERLEFLGDAVLELVVTEHLFGRFPNMDEGTLTGLRSMLVETKALTALAEELCLDKYIRMSKGESRDMKSRPRIMANACEALIGAIYKDQGFMKVREFIEKFVLAHLTDDTDPHSLKDPKSTLQEITQAIGIAPRYEVLSEKGKDHDKRFVIGLHIGNDLMTQGKGKSKKEAEQQAAEEMLRSLRKIG